MAKYDYVVGYIPLYKAALEDDWETAEKIFEGKPEAATAQITYWWETPLHIAAGTNSSHRFVEKLIERITPADGLRTTSYGGNNALHYAAKVGNTRAAKLMVEKLPDLTQIRNPYGNTALKLAAWHGQKKMLWYLLSKTKDEVGEDGSSPYRDVDGADLLTLSITADFYDAALYLVNKYHHLVTEKDRLGETALETLAARPHAFRSGYRLWFWQHFIYSCIPVKPEDAFCNPIDGVQEEYVTAWRSSREFGAGVRSLFKFGMPDYRALNNPPRIWIPSSPIPSKGPSSETL